MSPPPQRILILDRSPHLQRVCIDWRFDPVAVCSRAVVSKETDLAQLPETDTYLPSPVLQIIFYSKAWSVRKAQP
jgi:hypothetical protein